MSVETRLEMDRYTEQMFERRASGIPTVTFGVWRRESARLDEAFEDLRNARDAQIARDLARAPVYEEAEDDVAAEEQMESEFYDRKS